MNDKNINIILNTKQNLDNYKDQIVILRAGYYEKIKDHEICRLPTKLKAKKDFFYYNDYKTYDDTLDEAILIFCVDGKGVLNTVKSEYLIEKGYFAFCDKNTVHAYRTNRENPWTIYWFHFTGEFSDYFKNEINASKRCIIQEHGCSRDFLQKMQNIIDLLKEYPNYLKITTANSYLKICLSELIINKDKNFKNHNEFNKIIESAKEYMHDNLKNKLNLDDITNAIGISKYYFSRKFKYITGVTPITYFNQLKIQKACKMLTNNNQSIGEISTSLGYSTQYYFSECFKKHTGFSPRKYRKLKRTKY